MGTTTPNIQIYIPADGEENYGTNFANGMTNIDNHDHSGPPKGVQIGATGIADGSITGVKFNASVYGIGVEAHAVTGAIDVSGVLQGIYNISPNGFISRTGATTAVTRVITGTSNQITVTNGDGVSGNPTLSFPTTFLDSGTFTPTLQFDGTSTYAWTYVNQTGRWQRVGNLVFIQFYISTSARSGAAGSGTNMSIITGLPGGILPSTGVSSAVNFGYFDWGTIAGGYQVVGEFQTSGNILLHGLNTSTAGGAGIIAVGATPATSIVFGTGFYAIA